MATAGDGRIPYQSGGAGGKFRKKNYRRNIPATPYDRPPTSLSNNNPNQSLLTKIVDPASRLISASAHRLFDVFRKRLPSLSLLAPPGAGTNSYSTATGLSDVEQMLQEKTFTRSEIQRLTALLHSRTTEPPSDDAAERDRAKPSNSPSSLLRREASTSGSLKKYGDERDNLHATVSTPIVNPRVREEVASPAELAKAYMGTRSTKVSPLFDSATHLVKTPTTSVAMKTANSFRNLENGYVTPRSRGRSAMYNMARTPYPRSPSVYNQKGIGLNDGQSSALTSSQSAFGQERRMALKRRSSALDDDIGSGGVLRRTRQKANLLSQREKIELGYTSQKPDINSQKLLVTNGPEENGLGLGSGYGFVPSKSTQTASKILQQLEKPSPEERVSGSTKSPTKLSLDMLHGQALRSLEKVDSSKLLSHPLDTQKKEVHHHVKLHDNHEMTSKGKEKVEEIGSKKFPIPRNMLTSGDGDLTIQIREKTPIFTIADSPAKVPAESPPKKRAFQMSAPEDTFEIDDDDEVPVNNGHMSSPLVENNKPETYLVSNKLDSPDVIKTLSLPEPSRTPALVENNKPLFLDATVVPEQTELKGTENSSSTKTVNIVIPSPSTSTSNPSVVPQSPLQMNKVAPEKETNILSTAENESQLQFSVSEPSEAKANATSDPKALESTSVFSSILKTNHVKFVLPNKEKNGNENVNVNENVKVNSNGNTNGNGKAESLFSAVPVSTSKSVGSLFGNSTNNTGIPNTTPVSNPPTFPSLVPFQASFGANTTSFSNNTSSSVISATITTTAAATSTIFTSSVPAPIYSFGSATPKTAIAETGNNTNSSNDKELKLNTSSSPFTTSFLSTTTTTTATGSGLFGFSFPATTGTQANPPAASTVVTQSVPFTFGASSSSSLFGSSIPTFGSSTSFGVSSIAASSEGKSDKSASGPVFGSAWSAAPQSSGFGSSFGSSPFAFGASSTPTPATTLPITFGSSFSTSGATNSSFTTPTSKPLFGNPTPIFGAATVSPNNNDQMSVEDSMAADSMQTPSPISSFGQTPAAAPVSLFGQAPAAAPGFSFGSATPTPTQPPANTTTPGFSFGSATPTPTQPPANTAAPVFSFGSATPTPTQPAAPFQFGGQPNQTPPQNPFQSSSLEFNGGGGSFSLGSMDKSGRRIVKVNKNRNRKKP